MTIWFCIGTAAELIKIWPVALELEKRNIDWMILQTGQSTKSFLEQTADFKIAQNKILYISPFKHNFDSFFKALTWFLYSMFVTKPRLRALIPSLHPDDTLVVHGDTLSTLLGSFYGKALNLKVAHLEAGMRSHNLLNPFPEEICRRLVSIVADIHFCPDESAILSLKNEGVCSGLVLTHGNTIMDSLKEVVGEVRRENDPYIVVNFHRSENVLSLSRWNFLLEHLEIIQSKYRVIFVVMPNTKLFLDSHAHLKKRLEVLNLKIVERMTFSKFLKLIVGSSFIMTDSGTNQEECYYLGIPCLILRTVTERREGLNINCILSSFDSKITKHFLNNPEQYRSEPLFKTYTPSTYVVKGLVE